MCIYIALVPVFRKLKNITLYNFKYRSGRHTHSTYHSISFHSANSWSCLLHVRELKSFSFGNPRILVEQQLSVGSRNALGMINTHSAFPSKNSVLSTHCISPFDTNISYKKWNKTKPQKPCFDRLSESWSYCLSCSSGRSHSYIK